MTTYSESHRQLRTRLRGHVLTPADAGYDQARRVWNGAIDRRPAAIAQCQSVADVIAAVRFAAEADLPVAVRGGGHSFAGFGTCDGGLLVDLTPMKGIRVDPANRTVAAEGGVTWGELDHTTAPFGLATTGGLVSTTGIGGLTLGGGIGWLMRKHGLACDNLIGADVVTADGELIRTSLDDHPDLFWALRGGGGNFGVVTTLQYRLHPIATVLGGVLLYPADHATDLLGAYRESAETEPDELCTLVEFATAPEVDPVPPEHRGQPVVALGVCYCGPIGDGQAALAPWRAAAPLVADLVAPMPYPVLQAFFDEDYPAGMSSYVKAHYLDDLTPDAIVALVAAGRSRPTHRSFIDIHHLEGAVSRVGAAATAFGHRHARSAVLLAGISDDGSDLDACTAWAHQHWDALAPHATGGAYVNFIADTDDTAARSSWTIDTYERLTAVKTSYDPANRFRYNHNIRPDDGQQQGSRSTGDRRSVR